MRDLDLEADGAVLLRGAALSFLPELENALSQTPRDRPGVRLQGVAALVSLLEPTGPIGSIVGQRPVRAVLFDKSPTTNWSLGWHQDRTIAVEARHDLHGFAPWTRKAGLLHVEPPFEIIERMTTLRIHLDPVPADNAPLLIVPGSHRLGKIPVNAVQGIVDRLGTAACLAEPGDIWRYATSILHASAAASGDRRRRVLQVDYCSDILPHPLHWAGL